MGSVVVRRGRCRAEDEEEGRAGGRGVQLRYARGSRASRVCARTSTHPRTGIPAGPVRTLAGLQGRCARSLPGDPCAQLILLTRIAVPVQWRCRQSESRKTHHGRMSCTPRGFQLLQLSSRSKDTFSLPEWCVRIPELRPGIMWTCTVRAATIRSIVSEREITKLTSGGLERDQNFCKK